MVMVRVGARSPKDLGDVEGVMEVSGKRLDVPLLKKLTRLYGNAEVRLLNGLLKKHLGM